MSVKQRIWDFAGIGFLAVIVSGFGVIWFSAARGHDSGNADELMIAAWNGDRATIVRNLDQGTSINSVERGSAMTPLMYAAANGQLKTARTLIERGTDLSAVTRGCGTPLAHAARSGHEKVVELLLKCGANPSTPNADGYSPLMHAVAADSIVATQLLIRGGADVRAVDRWGQSAMEIARSNGNAEMICLLRTALKERSAKSLQSW